MRRQGILVAIVVAAALGVGCGSSGPSVDLATDRGGDAAMPPEESGDAPLPSDPSTTADVEDHEDRGLSVEAPGDEDGTHPSDLPDVGLPDTPDIPDIPDTPDTSDPSGDLAESTAGDPGGFDGAEGVDPDPDPQCRPCIDDSDCAAPGAVAEAVAEAICALRGPDGKFCVTGCDTARPCHDGYVCVEGADAGRAGGRGCRPPDGAPCPCLPHFVAAGYVTECYRENAFGRCAALRTCDQLCPAAEPGPEVCDGIDNDCDGATDEADAGGDGGAAGRDGNGRRGWSGAVACDDGNACTTDDRCVAGTCAGGGLMECGSDDLPCTRETCDPVVGCVNAPAADGTPCDDWDPCTTGDACAGGTCVGAGTRDCSDGNPCTDDTCIAGAGCLHVANDAPCEDGHVCTDGDRCTQGICFPGPRVCECDTEADCRALEDADLCNGTLRCDIASHACAVDLATAVTCDHTADTDCLRTACDPRTGTCDMRPVADGSPCEDGDACTVGDTCTGAGACASGPPAACDDGEACTADGCDPATGCVHAPIQGACDDGDACTAGDACMDGECAPGAPVACDDGNPCTDDSCDPAVGCANLPNSLPCEDGQACTVGDACDAGACVPGTNVCQCGRDEDCAPYEDGNRCNGTLRCDDSEVPWTCRVDPATVVTCDSSHDTRCWKSTCQPASGKCVGGSVPAGTPCSDNDACTTGDRCVGAACSPTGSVSCNDANGCTDDRCDSAVGCVNVPNTRPCNDGNACTAGDTCSGGKCSGTTVSCDDGEFCSDEWCDPKVGCLSRWPTLACDDGNPCTNDACVPGIGCSHSFSGTKQCSDGDPCTVGDTCHDGKCVGVPVVETCNGKDDDCDGEVDEGLCRVYRRDEDRDGWPVNADWRCLCTPAWPYTVASELKDDCDDADRSVHPGATDVCNEVDDDCDGTIDEGWGTAICGLDSDCDGDLREPGEECDDGNKVDWDGCTLCRLSEVKVSTHAGDAPTVAGLPGGRFVVAWSGLADLAPNVTGYAATLIRLIGPDGRPEGAEYRLKGDTRLWATHPSAAGLPGGGFVVAWRRGCDDTAWAACVEGVVQPTAFDVVAQVFGPDGVEEGDEVPVVAWDDSQDPTDLVADPDGRFLVLWQTIGETSVYLARHKADGSADVPAKEVSATAHAGRAAVLSDGRTVIAWKNPSGEVWLRIYDADLDAGSAPIRVNKAAYPASDAVDVEALADGRFVVAWGGTAPWSRTLLQMFTASGAPEGQMWMTGEAIRSVPAIAGSPDGGLIVTWQQGFIAFRRHSPSGMPTGATVVANRYGSGEQPAITPLEDGRFAIVWTGLPGHTIAAARFNADGTPAAP